MFPIRNPLDPISEHSKDTYNAPNLEETQYKIQQHLPSNFQDICKFMANEAQLFKMPAAQIMTDIYHQSMQKWPTFIKDTTLSDLRQHHINIFTALQIYQSRFTSSIYAPLHEYISTTNTKFKGSAEELILRISEIVNQVKNRRIMLNCGVQFDVRYTPEIASDPSIQCKQDSLHPTSEEEYDSESDDEEADEIQYTWNYGGANKLASLKTSRPIVSDILNAANIMKEDITKTDNSLRKIVRSILTKECDELTEFSYPRYEILMDDTKYVKTFPAIQNNTIPDIDIENIPLCRIYNSTNSVQSILDYLLATGQKQTSHLMTFSIHYYCGHIEIYFYIHANGKLYGSRMFEDDIMEIIPKLFENDLVEQTDIIHHNFKINNYVLNVEFDHPKKYEECKLVLFRRNQKVKEYELSYTLEGHLEQFISSWNSRHNKSERVDINEIVDIFIKYKIDYKYFDDENNREKFVKIIQRRHIATNIVDEFWIKFSGKCLRPLDVELIFELVDVALDKLYSHDHQAQASGQNETNILHLEVITERQGLLYYLAASAGLELSCDHEHVDGININFQPSMNPQLERSISCSESSDADLDAIMLRNDTLPYTLSDGDIDSHESSDENGSIFSYDDAIIQQKSNLSSDDDTKTEEQSSVCMEQDVGNSRVQPLPNAFLASSGDNRFIRIGQTFRSYTKWGVNVGDARFRGLCQMEDPSPNIHHLSVFFNILQTSIMMYFIMNLCLMDIMGYFIMFIHWINDIGKIKFE